VIAVAPKRQMRPGPELSDSARSGKEPFFCLVSPVQRTLVPPADPADGTWSDDDLKIDL
jgi:hypothetical protein